MVVPDNFLSKIVQRDSKRLFFDNEQSALLYLKNDNCENSLLYRNPPSYIWFKHPDIVDYYERINEGGLENYEFFAVENELNSQQQFISLQQIVFPSTQHMSVEKFSEIFLSFVNRTFKKQIHDELTFSRRVLEDFTVFIVSDIVSCSIRDYIIFIKYMEKYGISNKDFWKVSFEDSKIVFSENYMGDFIKYVKKPKSKPVPDCFERNYCYEEGADIFKDNGPTDMDIIDEIKSFCTWTSAVKDTETLRLDDIREKMYETFLANNLLVLKAGTGCTKTVVVTKMAKRHIVESIQPITVLFISNRIIYADSMENTIGNIKSWNKDSLTTEYESVTTASYTKFVGNIGNLLSHDIILMSIESLLKLEKEIPNVYNPFAVKNLGTSRYIIVLDEITETLANLFRETVRAQTHVFTYISKLIKYAYKVVTMSDDIKAWSVKALVNIRNKNTREPMSAAYYELTRRSLHHNAYMCFSESLTNSLLLNDIRVGKNIFIVCGRKSKVQSLQKMISGVIDAGEILIITADDNPDYIKINPICTWINFRVVIISPKITSGISFDAPHFDVAYAFIWDQLPVVTYKQMIARARILNEKHVVYCLEEKNMWEVGNYITSSSELDDILSSAAGKISTSIHRGITIPPYEVGGIDDDFNISFNSDGFKDLFYDVIIDRHLDLNNFTARFYKHIITECGNKFSNVEELISDNVPPPTKVSHALIRYTAAKDKKARGLKKAEKMIPMAIKLADEIENSSAYRRMGRVHTHGRPVYDLTVLAARVEVLSAKPQMTDTDVIEWELCQLVSYRCNVYTFLDFTEEVVTDWCLHEYTVFDFKKIMFWNKIFLTKKSTMKRIFYKAKQMEFKDNVAIDLRKTTTVEPVVVIEVLAKLWEILTGDQYDGDAYNKLLEPLSEEVDKNNYEAVGVHTWRNIGKEMYESEIVTPYDFLFSKDGFVLNNYMLLEEEHCTYLRDNIDLLMTIALYSKGRDDKKILYGNKDPRIYILNQNISFASNEEFKVGYTTMAPVYNLFKLILEKHAGVRIFKNCAVNLRMCVGNLEDFTRYSPSEDLDEYVESIKSQRGDIRKRIYHMAIHKKDVYKRATISKEAYEIIEDPQTYEIGKSDIVIEKRKKALKKRKREENNLLNLEEMVFSD